ncbi:hypothetical protein VTK56DRAFT_4911 [Thermocarpiscus australiensis]
MQLLRMSVFNPNTETWQYLVADSSSSTSVSGPGPQLRPLHAHRQRAHCRQASRADSRQQVPVTRILKNPRHAGRLDAKPLLPQARSSFIDSNPTVVDDFHIHSIPTFALSLQLSIGASVFSPCNPRE